MKASNLIYSQFINLENLNLAWKRVRYFDRPDSRDWVGLKVFAANRDYNLERLQESLKEKTFQPSYPEIKYLPKASQTLRPMAILTVSDRIVYQAIANIVAEKARPMLSTVANRQCFANVLSDPDQEPMFNAWKIQYHLFQKNIQTLYEEGNTWLAETDMAAFYETIDQAKLVEYLCEEHFLDELTSEFLKEWLPIWAAVKRGESIYRGLPQGCLASDFFANIFLYKFDKELSVQEYHYIRYVDDIRLLARNREAVQQGLIRIDRTLKTLGLLIQTSKTTVRQISNFEEEADRMASQLSEVDHRFRELNNPPDTTSPDTLSEPSLHDVALLGEDCDVEDSSLDLLIASSELQKDLIDLFWRSKKSIDSKGSDPFAERHLKFCLYRLEPNSEIVSAILEYLLDRPWLTETLHQYLRKCPLDQDAIKFLNENIIATHNVYDSTLAFTIETLMRQKVSLRSHYGLFRKWVTENKRDWPLLCAALIALGDNQENMSIFLTVISSSYSPSVRRTAIIQALRLARGNEFLHILNLGIYDDSPIVIDALLYQIYVEYSLTIDKLGLSDKQRLSEYTVNYARGYDNSLPHLKPCYIRHIFIKCYKVKFPNLVDFHTLLGTDYDRASDFLWQSEKSYLSNASRYVSQLDLFHEELLYPILVEKIVFKNTREELAKVSLTSRMEYIQSKEHQLRIFASGLLKCHSLRSSSTEAHTRLHQILDTTDPIDWHQRDALKKQLSGAYQELVDWLLM